jgi:MFS family permease
MVMPFTPDYLKQLGVGENIVEFWSGIIISVASVCSMIMSPIWGAVGDRFGRRMMLLRSGLFLTLGYVIMALVTGPYGLLLDRMMIGALTGFVPMAIALVGVSTPQEHVGWGLGIIQTAWPSGSIIGPVIGGVAADWIGIRGSSWISASMVLGATMLAFFTVREQFTPPAPDNKSSVLGDLRVAVSHKALVAIVLITAAANAAIMSLEPVLVPFVQQLSGANAPSWVSGLIFSVPGVAFILMAGWWVRKGEQISFTKTIAFGMCGSGVLYVLQAFVFSSWQLGGLRALSGISGAAIGPGVAALLSTAVPRDLRGRAFGLNQSSAALGSIIGPLLGGYIASFINARGVFFMAGVIYLIGWLWTSRVVERQVRAQHAA